MSDYTRTRIDDILCKYTSGEATLEETNAALKKTGASFHLEPGRNEITDAELSITWAGDTPEEANGWCLLDTGTGTMDKVKVVDGKLECAANQVQADGSTNMAAYVYIGGKRYEVFGDHLGEVMPRKTGKLGKLPKKPDMRRRSDLAGQEITQRTLAGDYRVTYDDFGYAISAVRVGRENGNHGRSA